MVTMKTFTFVIILICLHLDVQAITAAPKNCGDDRIDLVFVVPGNLPANVFDFIKEFVTSITSTLDIGLQESLVGVILFGNDTSIEFDVTNHTDEASLLTTIDNLQGDTPPEFHQFENKRASAPDYRTNTAAALDLLRTAGQPDGELNLRDGFTHVAMLITIIESNDEQATLTAASNLHSSNIYDQVYAIGVSGADATEPNAIASDPSLVFFISQPNTNGIAAVVQNITQQLMSCVDTTGVMGDPHFRVPLPSDETLCYSIQGYPGLAFNLIYSQDFMINALFIDSIGDEKEATWIGKLAVIPRHANKSEAVIFDSVKQEVVLVDQGHFRAFIVDKISYDESGKMSVKFTPGIAKQAGNPTVHVKYDKPLASFDVTFYSNHLDVNWDLKYDSIPDIHGLMGQFMVKGMAIDPMKKILTYPGGRDPVPVEKDDVMTGKTCWKAMNPGHQGEGLIKGSVLDYMVSNLLDEDFKLKKFL